TLALQQTRMMLPNLRAFWSRPLLSAALVPTFLSSPQPLSWSLPSLQSLLELFPPFLLAVPKKKTSHSRKAMRSANKGLKDKQNLVHCPGCGSPKLAHHLCPECYSSLNRTWKAKTREGSYSEMPAVSMSD
ncbi:hypothetical protein B0H21DRAFT_742520, partial [Amylocystis lapponica]